MKNKILSVIIFLSFLFLPTKILAQWSVDDPDMLGFGLPDSPIINIVAGIVAWLMAILGAVSIIAFIIAGIMYLTASGDETQAGKAKKAMTYSIIGVIVGLSGFVILQAAGSMLSGSATF